MAAAIELRDHQRGPVDAAGLGCANQFGAIGALAALHFGELVHELTGAIGEEASDYLALHVEPEAERALAGGAQVVVGDQGAGRDDRITSLSTNVDEDVFASRRCAAPVLFARLSADPRHLCEQQGIPTYRTKHARPGAG